MEKQVVVSALAALAQETRLDIFRLLVRAGPRGLPAGDVGEALSLPSATLSFHLKELKSAGLARCERQGRRRIYSPDLKAIQALIGFLTESCCHGVGEDRSASRPDDGACPTGCLPEPPRSSRTRETGEEDPE